MYMYTFVLGNGTLFVGKPISIDLWSNSVMDLCNILFSADEAHVYTLGFIGEHRVVSTKLPQIGRNRGAQISAGNNTTRLLGNVFVLITLNYFTPSPFYIGNHHVLGLY